MNATPTIIMATAHKTMPIALSVSRSFLFMGYMLSQNPLKKP